MNPLDQCERHLIISADAHAGADVQSYRDYLPSRWHDEFDAWAVNAANRWNARNEGRENSRNWDSAQRVRENEADGVVAELIFPNTIPPFYPRHDLTATLPTTRDEYERRFAGLQANNRWAVDFCSQAPGRRRALVQIMLNDVDDALAEIRWGKQAGLAGVLIPAVRPGHPLPGLWSRQYDPIWALADELDMPVNQHVGAGAPEVGTDPAELAAWVFETRFYSQRTVWHLIYGGVFERFPRTRFIMTEEGLDWVGPTARRLENMHTRLTDPRVVHSRLFGPALAGLSLRPTDYIQRNCYIGASGEVRHEDIANRSDIGVGHIMFGSDYPHDEGTFPFTGAAVRALFWDVPVQEARRMLGLNTAEIYGFDVGALMPLARQFGPTVVEVHTRLDAYPVDSTLELTLGRL
jgi:predicted TIM-barrel fold metal-dependent hydrolase